VLPYWNRDPEENPAMGWRAIRIALDRPAMLRQQLRAMMNAAAGRTLSVMFPMVTEIAEFDGCRRLLDLELRRQARRNISLPSEVRVGAMVEVPALLWQLPELLKETDFISVGTNDLVQFLYAADRGTPSLYDRYDFLSQPVLDILEKLITAANEAQVPISVCGQAASKPLEALVLAALGIPTLSMPASGVLPMKAMFSGVDLSAFRKVLAAVRKGGTERLREPLAAWTREQGVFT